MEAPWPSPPTPLRPMEPSRDRNHGPAGATGAGFQNPPVDMRLQAGLDNSTDRVMLDDSPNRPSPPPSTERP